MKQPSGLLPSQEPVGPVETTEQVNATEALQPTDYKNANLDEIARSCLDLSTEQQQELLQVLKLNESLFVGKHGEWKGTPVTITLIEDAKPIWAKPYPVPLKNREVFKQELNCQCSIGALQELSAEEIKDRKWASPAFGIPKKNGTIRLVIDFCRINQCLKCKEYPLPTIDEIMQDINGFVFTSVIDLNMGYLSIPLTEPTKKLLTIVTTFGFFECCVLPMGIKPATDIFQSRMVGIFQPMRNHKPSPYIDHIFHGKGDTFDKHLLILNNIFNRLKQAAIARQAWAVQGNSALADYYWSALGDYEDGRFADPARELQGVTLEAANKAMRELLLQPGYLRIEKPLISDDQVLWLSAGGLGLELLVLIGWRLHHRRRPAEH